jgi:catechol 2,3-dioxygenase-like lactoylglutathione lyase family enzyme
MFENASVYAYVPVKDLQRGREFYETILGFKPASEVEGVGVTYECANKTAFFMYLSEGAGSNKASTLFWVVDDIDAILSQLRQKGVKPIDYNMPGIQTETSWR